MTECTQDEAMHMDDLQFHNFSYALSAESAVPGYVCPFVCISLNETTCIICMALLIRFALVQEVDAFQKVIFSQAKATSLEFVGSIRVFTRPAVYVHQFLLPNAS